jgi:hypothetical protein
MKIEIRPSLASVKIELTCESVDDYFGMYNIIQDLIRFKCWCTDDNPVRFKTVTLYPEQMAREDAK